jgi:hypothetical protein
MNFRMVSRQLGLATALTIGVSGAGAFAQTAPAAQPTAGPVDLLPPPAATPTPVAPPRAPSW